MKETEKTTLWSEDFNLEKKYELFEVIHTLSKDETENEVKSWCVIGHVLNSSSNSRKFEYELCSYPISVFVQQNRHARLSDFENSRYYVSKNRVAIIQMKLQLLRENFEAKMAKLEDQNK